MSLPFRPQAILAARPWQTHPRETIAVGLLGAALLALAGVSGATPVLPSFGSTETEAQPAVPLAKPLPNQIRDLAPATALQVNATIPLATGPNPAATPFAFGNSSAETRARALECLTSAIYYEAAQEPTDGQRGVAQVILNRVRHPAFPNSVCGVVYEGSTRATGCQFTFTCDGSMARAPLPDLWNRARKVADEALKGAVYAPVGLATHYHANYVVPYWASSLVKTSVQGAHIFYRWPGGWGRPAAFNDRWTAVEGNPSALRLAALSAPHSLTPLTASATTVEKLEAAAAKLIEGKDGRVRLLFTPEAREAVEKVKHVDYVQRVAASDNLKFALDGGTHAAERPFGRSTEGTGSAVASSTTSSTQPQLAESGGS
ncbi:cell wall hydrolase [Sphingomonas sp. RB56-2]|uniref:Cell wall hydrolase n=1 Tax=Sphingomonas brevis TaxID=2908206 RepID=A0ABT0S782_9SPHN|nr:cell wall hydrolase [Sphingomonas brevis]MCL6740015.1 cell wall hydrolase [Sphingomonas brevis]